MKSDGHQERDRSSPWILQAFCCFGLILAFASLSWAAAPGDANDDGKISRADLPVLVDHILGKAQAPGDPDCNGDQSVNIQDVICLLNVLSSQPPPDPAEVAPPVDPTVATNLFTATEFLYKTGIQTGVAPGTIEPRRVAVLRGKVLDRDNSPLAGVKITILDHPEFGQTQSRTDGMFDMAINGGGYLTVKYQQKAKGSQQSTLKKKELW